MSSGFYFFVHTWSVLRILSQTHVKELSPFPSRSLKVSGLPFKSLVHTNFVSVSRLGSNFSL